MDKAAARLHQALTRGETIAVFGDYDVDGITATCLLTEFLQSQGGRVIYHIPARIEEGYGLNTQAIAALRDQGASLIVTVDCGITADAEAAYCRELGVDLIITDHHECRDELPPAVAVVDPHRKDQPGPVRYLARRGRGLQAGRRHCRQSGGRFAAVCRPHFVWAPWPTSCPWPERTGPL